MRLPIYLDSNATTPVDPAVLERMLPYFTESFGNAASKTHSFGWEADRAVQTARTEVAAIVGAKPREIVFTSGATEADNQAILGAAERYRMRGGTDGHIVTSAIEHPAILDPCDWLEKRGFRVTRVRPDRTGRVSVEAVEAALEPDTFLVSVMHVNNEVGTVNPVAELGAMARERDILFHTDAAQGVGKVPTADLAAHVDLISFTGHKFYGPKGVGALYVRNEIRERIAPILHGGGHERGLRSGTLSVPLIVGLGAACAVADEKLASDMEHARTLAARLAEGLTARLPGVRRNGHPDDRAPGTVHVTIPKMEAQSVLVALPEVAISAGSACSSAEATPSHVLTAMGMSKEEAAASLRFGIGRFNREDEIDYVLEAIPPKIESLQKLG